MTALSKSTLRALWISHFQPTSGNFSDLIDSWTDYSGFLTTLDARVSAGGVGLLRAVSTTSVSFQAIGAAGAAFLSAASTTAAALAALGGGAVGVQLFATSNTAAAQAALAGGAVGIQLFGQTTTAAVQAIIGATTPVVASTRNAVLAYSTAASLSITADEVILKDAGGGAYLASTVSLTATITSSGANGLDTGAEASSTWYYVWVIYNGATVSSLLSTSSTAPTMPSGYTFKALVGTVRNDGSSNFIRFYQQDRMTWLVAVNIFTSKAAGGIDTYEVLAGADLTAFQAAVPPIAKSAFGLAGTVTATSAVRTIVAGDTNGVGSSIQGDGPLSVGVVLEGFAGATQWDVPLISSQNLAWKNLQVTSAENRLNVTGYRI